MEGSCGFRAERRPGESEDELKDRAESEARALQAKDLKAWEIEARSSCFTRSGNAGPKSGERI